MGTDYTLASPHQRFPIKSEAERMEDAAAAAMADGDVEHAKDLYSRAKAARRRARENAAGVSNPWDRW